MDISYVYTKPRKDFGRYVAYERIEASVLLDYVPNPDEAKDVWTEEQVSEKSIQVGHEFSEHTINTHRITVEVKGVEHKQGGWPREVDPSDAEHTTRFRKKVERDPGYLTSTKACVDRLDSATLLNNAMDLTQRYFAAGDESLLSTQPPSVKVLSIFRDPASIKRAARRVLWAPESSKSPKKFVTSLCNLMYQYDIELNRALARTSLLSGTELVREGDGGVSVTGGEPNVLEALNLQQSSSYIFDVRNSNSPDFELIAPSSNASITAVRYSAKDANILFAGLYNGQVGFYDCRRSHHIVSTSEVSISHSDPVHDLYVVKSKSGTEFATISTDGKVLWWDSRKLSESLDSLDLYIPSDDPGQGSRPGTKLGRGGPGDEDMILIGGTCLNIDPIVGLSKFVVGTEAGHIIHCNRKNKPNERITQVLLGHNGPTRSIIRSPFFGKYFLSCADWCIKLWADDIRTPIITTTYSSGSIRACHFSNTRPGIFAAARSDGYLDVYDLLYKVDQPTLSCRVSNSGLCSLEIDATGEYILTGSEDGSIHMLQTSESLHVSNNMLLEKQFVQSMFERESKREKALEQRGKELKLKSNDAGPKGPRDVNIVIDTELLRTLEEEYLNFCF
ncbi:Dynein intermediate chain [Giardia muris]|uniref:Dynein intermediate chain n=1 Tax=Giardia muris TaxID=5742 RepID=A0A4Z1SPZ3_GIAMU|nr:Dynein intermediate chain [Giardia muris]|eukprot:TNJ27904.1 Dynein intermediate chain [Giardia muris]